MYGSPKNGVRLGKTFALGSFLLFVGLTLPEHAFSSLPLAYDNAHIESTKLVAQQTQSVYIQKANQLLRQALDIAKREGCLDWSGESLARLIEVYGAIPDLAIADAILSETLTAIQSYEDEQSCQARPLIATAKVYENISDSNIQRQGLDRVLTVAQAMNGIGWEAEYKTNAIANIALSYQKIGDTQKAHKILEYAIKVAVEPDDSWHVSRALVPIIQAYGQLEDLEVSQADLRQILNTVPSLETSPSGNGEAFQSAVLGAIAKAYSKFEDTDILYEDLVVLLSYTQRLSYFYQYGSLEEGPVTNVIPVYGSFKDASLAEQGLDEILVMVDDWDDPEKKVNQLIDLSNTFQKINKVDRVSSIFNQVLQFIISLEDEQQKSLLFMDFLSALTQLEDSISRMGLLEVTLNEIKNSERRSHPIYYLLASQSSYRSGDLDMTISLLKEAQDLAEAGNGELFNPRLLADVAMGYIAIGDLDTAYKILSKAVDSVQAIPDDGWASIELSLIMPIYSDIGNTPPVRQGLDKILTISRHLEDPIFKSRTMNDLASAYLEIGDVEISNKILCENLEASPARMENPYFQAESLTGILDVYNEFDSLALDETCISAISRFASSMQDSEDYSYSSYKSEVFRELALTYLKTGETSLAEESLQSALSATNQIKYPFEDLVEIAAIYLKF